MRHGGEAKDVVEAYERLTPKEQEELREFLNSLCWPLAVGDKPSRHGSTISTLNEADQGANPVAVLVAVG